MSPLRLVVKTVMSFFDWWKGPDYWGLFHSWVSSPCCYKKAMRNKPVNNTLLWPLYQFQLPGSWTTWVPHLSSFYDWLWCVCKWNKLFPTQVFFFWKAFHNNQSINKNNCKWFTLCKNYNIKVTFPISSHHNRVDYLVYPFIVFMRY